MRDGSGEGNRTGGIQITNKGATKIQKPKYCDKDVPIPSHPSSIDFARGFLLGFLRTQSKALLVIGESTKPPIWTTRVVTVESVLLSRAIMIAVSYERIYSLMLLLPRL